MSKNPALVVKKSYWQLLKWKDHENRPSVKVWSRGLMRQFARKEISRETRFLFICGLHRSGTSILHEVLREHNSVVGFQNTGVPEDEGQHLQTVMRRDIEDGGPGFFAFSEEACLTESSRVATDANFLKLRRQWGRFLKTGENICIEKSPPNLVRSRFLQAAFPNSSFLFVVRHPIATSLATHRFSKTASQRPLSTIVKHWQQAHSIMLDDLSCLDRAAIIRYEDFVLNSQEICRHIFEWLGLQEDEHASSVVDHNLKYFSQWQEDHLADNLYDTEMEEFLQMFGYQMTAPFVVEAPDLTSNEGFSGI